MLYINDLTRIYLGNQGENLAQTIEIDVSDWLVRHPDATISIWHKRNGDEVPYPVGAILDRDNGVIRWSPTNTDTYVSGEGQAEIRLTENDVIKKCRTLITGISPSVTGSGVPLGSGWKDYIDHVEGLYNYAFQNQYTAEAWANGERNGVPVSQSDITWHNNSRWYKDLAEQAVEHKGYMYMYIDENTGHLIYNATNNLSIDFEIQEGRLNALWPTT